MYVLMRMVLRHGLPCALTFAQQFRDYVCMLIMNVRSKRGYDCANDTDILSQENTQFRRSSVTGRPNNALETTMMETNEMLQHLLFN